jgi:N-acetylglucosaminyldiphosphoundecaprenol N-acetyl-beta-D-mannosaminyltransferase
MLKILGVKINEFNKAEILERLNIFLLSKEPRYIVTLNPEIILKATKDEEYFYILNKADLVLADGFGLKIAGWLRGRSLPRLTGADLTPEILKMAEKEKKRVLIINWRRGLSSSALIEKSLRAEYPNLKFYVKDADRNFSILPNDDLLKINFDVMFVTLGAPYQEKFIFHNYKKLPGLKLAIGVGGTFDFITKQTSRAPLTLRRIGLEWLWRLFKKPSHAKRVYNAVFKFSLAVLNERFIRPFLYRPNVACLLYKKDKNDIKILLVEREDQENHFQLPQGGTDGHNLATAGFMELSEELNTSKFKIKATFKNLYRYNNSSNKKHVGYRGQKQGLVIAEFYGTDKDIKINFWEHISWRWISINDLTNFIHPIRRHSTEIFLKKFKEFLNKQYGK